MDFSFDASIQKIDAFQSEFQSDSYQKSDFHSDKLIHLKIRISVTKIMTRMTDLIKSVLRAIELFGGLVILPII